MGQTAKRIPKRKRTNAGIGGETNYHQVSFMNQIPLELRLLSSYDEEDEERIREFEEEQRRETQERVQRQAEKERQEKERRQKLLRELYEGTDTESAESSSD